ncbi:MAG TPA: ATP-binding protein [Thermoanaerobaculia bacterium]|jgi:signal transduction histidine kinase|nr:ATP-binding protein [Thermoanaerobaculia bacterium]
MRLSSRILLAIALNAHWRGCGWRRRSATKSPRSSGLGLAPCNEIIEAHGGRMRLQAAADGGTTVTCWLPA